MLKRSTRLALCQSLLVLCILPEPGCGPHTGKNGLAVTYIANEGFMIAMGSTKVLIDALPQSTYYRNPSDSTVASLVNNVPPFESVDYFLVTHDHPDHFNAELMSRFLQQHHRVHFIAGRNLCSTLHDRGVDGPKLTGLDLGRGQGQTVNEGGAEIVALPLIHTGNPDYPNLGFIVRVNGCTFMHVGDARLEYNEEILRTVDWHANPVDILFIEYFDSGEGTLGIIEKLIRPRYVILMHVPGGEEARVAEESKKFHLPVIVFRREGETRAFDLSARPSE